MIDSKSGYATFCRSIHDWLKHLGHDIKLASVRERVATSYQYRTTSALLSDLPIEFEVSFIPKLIDELNEHHRISIMVNYHQFPFDAGFVLSESEARIVWDSFKTSIRIDNNSPVGGIALLLRGLTKDSFDSMPPPNGLRPNGKGKWYCSKENELTEMLDAITIDPLTLFDPKSITPELVQNIVSNLKELIIEYWDKNASWHLNTCVANLLSAEHINAKGLPVDVSQDIDTPFSQWVSGSNELLSLPPQQLMTINHPFRTTLTGSSTFEEALYFELVDMVLGRYLFNSDSSKSVEKNLWGVLQSVSPCSDKHQYFTYYQTFIYSPEFKEALGLLSKEWLNSQTNWTKPLRELAVIPFSQPKVETDKYYTRQNCLSHSIVLSDGVKMWVSPLDRSVDEFGYHDEYVSFDVDDEEEFDDEEILPFENPFCIEEIAVDRTLEAGETDFIVFGYFFSNLTNASELGRHYDLMDSISQDLSNISRFVKKSNINSLSTNSVFYMSELLLSQPVNLEELAREFNRAFLANETALSDTMVIINTSCFTDRYYIGYPYGSAPALQKEYLEFVNKFVQAIEPYAGEVHLFSA
ncbi:hypothetical protein A1QO_02620 [Vibrio genomosp. F10 str. ZF-129]|uniref:Uncharacterized protein n=1 Tax=Vibrio genomosp. F10 str. ZF-129 TaxID=1187848 RepID=A0A1E5BK94_9VIBR|nr:hypothetical protein [Vibrio genomosp. F10]OEE38291.1 hypothetical protein A1QO_02620 [Vibrio genomosp. F10 str. ZF-129]